MTSQEKKPNRRLVLAGGAAAAFAGVVPAAAAYSTEYVAWRQAHAACDHFYATEDPDAYGNAAYQMRADALCDVSFAAACRLANRAPKSWDHVAETAHMVFIVLWDDRTWTRHSECNELEAGLLKAILSMKPLPPVEVAHG